MLRVGVVERSTVLDGARKGNYTGITVTVLLSRVQEPWDRSYRMGAVEIHHSRGNPRRQNQHLEAGKCVWFGLLRVSPFASDTPDPMVCPLWAWQFTNHGNRKSPTDNTFSIPCFHMFSIVLTLFESVWYLVKQLRGLRGDFWNGPGHSYHEEWNLSHFMIIGSTCSTEFYGIRNRFTLVVFFFTTQTDSNSQRLLRCLRWEPSTLSEWRHGVQNRPTFCLSEDGPMVLSTPQSLSITPKWLGPQQASVR